MQRGRAKVQVMARAKAMARKEGLEKVRAREAIAKWAMARERERDGEASIRVEKGQVYMGWKAITMNIGQCLVDTQDSKDPKNGLPRWVMGGIRGAKKDGTITAGGGRRILWIRRIFKRIISTHT